MRRPPLTRVIPSKSRAASLPRHQLSPPACPESSLKHPESCQAQTLSHVSPSIHNLMSLSDAADAESPLKDSELQVLRSQYLKEQEAQHITVQTKFNYAWGLIKSNRHNDQLEGVTLLTGTLRPFQLGGEQLTVEIYKESPGRRRECLYYLALGQYKLSHYTEARRYNDLLLEKEPRNMQALSLKALIEDRVATGMTAGVELTGRGICWDGYCWECRCWIYCCCDDVGETEVIDHSSLIASRMITINKRHIHLGVRGKYFTVSIMIYYELYFPLIC
jgi:fission 1 protein